LQRPGKNDGCAIIFNAEVLKLVQKNEETYKSGEHIMLSCLFITKSSTPKEFWVLNTHVNYNKREEDLLELKNVAKKLVEAKNALVLFMGDFNAEANEKWYETYQKDGVLDIFYGVIKKNPL
jgi:endonuclease/exonuclease/phosphatase family metal-dependent hydrolase